MPRRYHAELTPPAKAEATVPVMVEPPEQPREDQRHGKHKPQLLGGDQKPLKLRIPAAAQEGDQKGQEK